ncbi:MAG TPA: hypothetical protein VG052_12600 [Puia sp.]|jgi:hypothetical protein|nr:hypothetical protein [Puia sp.]
MKSSFIFLTSLSILLPIIAGLIRFRRIGKRYQPFFIVLLAGLATELVSRYLIKIKQTSNADVVNVDALLEWILIFWQFRVWGFFRTRKYISYTLLFLPCAVWIAENLILGHGDDFSPYFRFFYAFLIVMLSVNKINFMITHNNRNLLGHPDLLICIGFIIYFIYDIIYEWAYQSSLVGATDITTTIISLFGYINALTNIIFAIALLKIPAPEKFTLR